ncbi:MAG: tetratricopeptide repeat protein [Chloroflexi bacterium]|nr:tetratricopeptide repeat protein [Chloroflexota bacterium]
MPTTPVTGLRVRGLAEQAVSAALDADWPRAIELNKQILESAPEDPEAHNRLARALLELGRLDEAKAAIAEVLKVEPNNSVAIRNAARIATLTEHKSKPNTTKSKTQPRLFIEDMGKTGILRLINPAPIHVLAKYSPGAEAELREQEGLLAVHARDGELLGFLEPKVGRRLLDLLKTGNQYVIALVSNDHQNPRIAIRETFQSLENAQRISFPGHHRPAETKERAYIKGTFFRFGDDEGETGDGDEAEDTAVVDEVVADDDADAADEPVRLEAEDDDEDEEPEE